MNNMRSLSVWCAITALLISADAGANAASTGKTKQSSSAVTPAQLRKTVENYIKKEMSLKGGFFLQYDDLEEKTLKLKFTDIQKKVLKTKDGKYLVTGSFAIDEYKPTPVELDFILMAIGASAKIQQIKVRSIDGKPRYQYSMKTGKKKARKKGTMMLAPDFRLKDMEGNEVTLSQYEGRIVILNFWASWCPPCKAEIPDLVDLYTQYRSKGLEIIGISLDPDGYKAIDRFTDNQKINYKLLIGNLKVSSLYGGIEAIPTTFIITRDGYIYQKHVGYRSKDMFEKDIKTLFK